MGVEDGVQDEDDQNYSYRAILRIENEITYAIMRSKDRTKGLEIAITKFKPKHAVTKQWYHECINEGLQSWINNDPAITALWNERPLSPLEHKVAFYRAAMKYAMMDGDWPPYMKAKARQYAAEMKKDDETKDCA